MTDLELYNLIAGDATATALANAGNDSGCAARCMEIANPVRRKIQLSRIGLVDLYTATLGLVGAMLADQVLIAIKNISLTNSLVENVYSFTGPGTHPESYPDWGSANLQAILMAPTQQNGCGLTQEQLGPLLAATFVPPTITGNDISRVWRGAV